MTSDSRRKIWIGVAATVTIIFTCAVSFDAFATFVLKSVVGGVTGTHIEADRAHLNPFTGRLSVRNMRVMNPKGFPKGELADIALVEASFDTMSFLRKAPRVHEVTVDVREIVVIHNKEGHLNVDALKIVHDKDVTTTPLSIGKLVLSVDHVVQKDYTGPKPVVQLHELKIKNATYENLPNAAQLVGVVLGQALQAAAIKGAMIYGTAAVAGIAFLPLGAAFFLASNDSAESDVRASYGDAVRAAEKTASTLGEVSSKDRRRGAFKATVNGVDVSIDITKVTLGKSHVRVTARKMLMPQPKTAGGLLHEIMEITG